MKRRQFIKKLTFVGVMTTAAALPFGLGRALHPELSFDRRKLLRPPGSVKPDAHFQSACIGCGLCAQVCPPKCIQFHKSSGGSKQQTPYIDPQLKGCILCGECMKACPTGALKITELTKVTMGVAKIDRTTCYPWVDKGICGACVSICPLGERAIKFKYGNIYRPFVTDQCVGCGLCVEVCPHPAKPIAVTAATS